MGLRLPVFSGKSGANTRRTVIFGGIAALLAALTFYDYTQGPSSEKVTSAKARVASISPNTTAGPSGQWRELTELRHLRDHAEGIRKRYEAIAVPYAEGVATFATLYGPGQPVRDEAGRAIRSLIPAEVEVKDLLVAEAGPTDRGIVWFTATISLASGDSQAMGRTLLSLGDAANGMVWKELSAATDAEHRRVQAKGQLAVLMLPQAE
jgi:hypothetical protein